MIVQDQQNNTLRHLKDTQLIVNTEKVVREEREKLTSVLYHLLEVDRRRLYSELKYKSLLDFAVRRLGYPEDQAYRRISAMRLLREIPAVEEKISSGEISLTHIGLAQTLFRQEKKLTQKDFTSEEKMEVLHKISNKSVREAEKVTLSLSSAPAELRPDKIKAVTEENIETRFIASEKVRNKIEILKGLLAHKNPDISIGELFEKLCDLGINNWQAKKSAAPRDLPCHQSKMKTRNHDSIAPSSLSKAAISRQVFSRAGHACENCASTFALEIDHVFPEALGGEFSLENLRLLCKSCNQRSAIHFFGQSKMSAFINPENHEKVH